MERLLCGKERQPEFYRRTRSSCVRAASDRSRFKSLLYQFGSLGKLPKSLRSKQYVLLYTPDLIINVVI